MSLKKEEEAILDSIHIASENNPLKPEFPPGNAKFPATPTYKITVPGFTNVYLKDESYNPTGTHKDRMAWEIIVTYRDFLLAKKRKANTTSELKSKIKSLPHLSILTSGSAGFAIQYWLRHYKLPKLNCLVDKKINPTIRAALKKVGAQIFETDLHKKRLSWKDILSLTHNKNGFDITSSEALDPTTRFYDWLSYEIINSSPNYCFIPFGTGNLYENILNITKREVTTSSPDPRFKGSKEILQNCNFIGATTNNPKSKAEKLYSPHLPFVHYDEQWIKLYKYAGYCGQESNVHIVKESFLNKAISFAKKAKMACEPSGIAGLAMLFQMQKKIPKDAKILIVNTGRTKYELA